MCILEIIMSAANVCCYISPDIKLKSVCLYFSCHEFFYITTPGMKRSSKMYLTLNNSSYRIVNHVAVMKV